VRLGLRLNLGARVPQPEFVESLAQALAELGVADVRTLASQDDVEGVDEGVVLGRLGFLQLGEPPKHGHVAVIAKNSRW
jgi:hypothetical protein